MIIYKVTNNVNSKIYVGKTTKTLEERKRGHYDSSKYLRRKINPPIFHKAIRKHGWNSFLFEQIDIADTEEELSSKETYWISKLNSFIPYGYNMTTGGEGWSGVHHTEESKQKISYNKLGSVPWNKGKTDIYGKETLDNMSRSLRKSHFESGKTKIVVNETTGEVFQGIREASETYGVNNSTISRACNKARGKSRVKGCLWRYEINVDNAS